MIEIASLHVYPLKGGRSVDMAEVVLDRFGPQGDRRWLVADLAGDDPCVSAVFPGLRATPGQVVA